PNKGDPFLEYIWTNRIPVNQENKETRLQIEEFKYGSNDELHDKLTDFSLKIHWYIRDNEDNVIKKDEETDKMEKEGIKKSENMQKREKIIKRKDIIEKFHAVKHACKALEHLNKRYKSKYVTNNYTKAYEVG